MKRFDVIYVDISLWEINKILWYIFEDFEFMMFRNVQGDLFINSIQN